MTTQRGKKIIFEVISGNKKYSVITLLYHLLFCVVTPLFFMKTNCDSQFVHEKNDSSLSVPFCFQK